MRHARKIRVNPALAAQAAELLSVTLEGLDEGTVDVAYRSAALTAHPDKGGSSEDFVRVRHARDILVAYCKAPPLERAPEVDLTDDCMRCSGKGFIMQQRGWRSLRVNCPDCRGKGFTVRGEVK